MSENKNEIPIIKIYYTSEFMDDYKEGITYSLGLDTTLRVTDERRKQLEPFLKLIIEFFKEDIENIKKSTNNLNELDYEHITESKEWKYANKNLIKS